MARVRYCEARSTEALPRRYATCLANYIPDLAVCKTLASPLKVRALVTSASHWLHTSNSENKGLARAARRRIDAFGHGDACH